MTQACVPLWHLPVSLLNVRGGLCRCAAFVPVSHSPRSSKFKTTDEHATCSVNNGESDRRDEDDGMVAGDVAGQEDRVRHPVPMPIQTWDRLPIYHQRRVSGPTPRRIHRGAEHLRAHSMVTPRDSPTRSKGPAMELSQPRIDIGARARVDHARTLLHLAACGPVAIESFDLESTSVRVEPLATSSCMKSVERYIQGHCPSTVSRHILNVTQSSTTQATRKRIIGLMDNIASTGKCKKQRVLRRIDSDWQRTMRRSSTEQAEEQGQNEAPAVENATCCRRMSVGRVRRWARSSPRACELRARRCMARGGVRQAGDEIGARRGRGEGEEDVSEHQKTKGGKTYQPERAPREDEGPPPPQGDRPTIQPSNEPTETFQKRLPQTRPGLPVASRRAADPTRRPGLQAKRAPVCQQ
ncbi:hypothetical protein EV715DRAFT_268162 [Schizophyllum commune]